jgi:hypothetical protein
MPDAANATCPSYDSWMLWLLSWWLTVPWFILHSQLLPHLINKDLHACRRRPHDKCHPHEWINHTGTYSSLRCHASAWSQRQHCYVSDVADGSYPCWPCPRPTTEQCSNLCQIKPNPPGPSQLLCLRMGSRSGLRTQPVHHRLHDARGLSKSAEHGSRKACVLPDHPSTQLLLHVCQQVQGDGLSGWSTAVLILS